jgi:hypothetical protein
MNKYLYSPFDLGIKKQYDVNSSLLCLCIEISIFYFKKLIGWHMAEQRENRNSLFKPVYCISSKFNRKYSHCILVAIKIYWTGPAAASSFLD